MFNIYYQIFKFPNKTPKPESNLTLFPPGPSVATMGTYTNTFTILSNLILPSHTQKPTLTTQNKAENPLKQTLTLFLFGLGIMNRKYDL